MQFKQRMPLTGPDVCHDSKLKKIFGKSSYDRKKCAKYFSMLSDIISHQVGPQSSERILMPGQSMSYFILRSKTWCVSKTFPNGERLYAKIKLELSSAREDTKTYIMLYTNEGYIGREVKRVISEGVFQYQLNF
jgi:hypothetical protein